MDGRKELAKAVDREIERRGWSQADVIRAGGPSTTTQTTVRKTDAKVSGQTQKMLDAAFGWPEGTSAQLLAGELAADEVNSGAVVDLTAVSDEQFLQEFARRFGSSRGAIIRSEWDRHDGDPA